MSFVTVYEYVCVSFPFGFEGGMWELIVPVPDHCLSNFTLVLVSVSAGRPTYLYNGIYICLKIL